jgi:hypothetical protein
MPAAIRASGALGNPASSLTSARPRRSSGFVHHLATGRSPPKKIFSWGLALVTAPTAAELTGWLDQAAQTLTQIQAASACA